jgi:hypothetical protein
MLLRVSSGMPGPLSWKIISTPFFTVRALIVNSPPPGMASSEFRIN